MRAWRTCVAAAGLAALAAAAAPARAEIYRCQRPDGTTLLTSDASRCPGAPAHEPEVEVQRSPGRAAPAAEASARGSASPLAPLAAGRRAAAEEAAQAAAWRSKRASAEQALREVNERLPVVQGAVKFCNRGGDLYVEDDSGLRHGYSCDRVDAEYSELEQRRRELEQYLAEGLAEECRRAGCLPGWLR